MNKSDKKEVNKLVKKGVKKGIKEHTKKTWSYLESIMGYGALVLLMCGLIIVCCTASNLSESMLIDGLALFFIIIGALTLIYGFIMVCVKIEELFKHIIGEEE